MMRLLSFVTFHFPFLVVLRAAWSHRLDTTEKTENRSYVEELAEKGCRQESPLSKEVLKVALLFRRLRRERLLLLMSLKTWPEQLLLRMICQSEALANAEDQVVNFEKAFDLCLAGRDRLSRGPLLSKSPLFRVRLLWLNGRRTVMEA
ncbi:hypothetical protein Nepgr_028876 [Nepenthes gracilis]|uniref:Secreted protein n=1 Tax=Nepenthes gracilis TaxID=150966 RepID=A0AAD3TBJ1_NEPGR|nr:hypothetical protein Nepgr_028876 [Nepenthes gracilis]